MVETQTRTLVFAGRAMVDLPELVEDVGEDVWGDANTGIADGDRNLALDALGANPDLALIGVLDRITGQIEQDLAEPHLVAHNQGQVCREIDAQGKPFAAASGATPWRTSSITGGSATAVAVSSS